MQQPFGNLAQPRLASGAQTSQHGPDAAPARHGPQAATMDHGPDAAPRSCPLPPKAPPEEYVRAPSQLAAAVGHAPKAPTIQHGPHTLTWRGPRVRSDPAVGHCDDEDSDGGPPYGGRGPARNTLGNPGFDSPTGQRTLGKIWHRLKSTHLQCRPRLEISAVISSARVTFMWVIIWWMPLQEPGMLRPWTYHTTVARASAIDRNPGELRIELDLIQNTLWHLLMNLLGPLPYRLGLRNPPWHRSWNFGIDEISQDIATAIRIASSIMLTRLPGVLVAEHRPIHISWT